MNVSWRGQHKQTRLSVLSASLNGKTWYISCSHKVPILIELTFKMSNAHINYYNGDLQLNVDMPAHD